MKSNKSYWQENLISWESSRYGIHSITNPFAIPLRKRMKACRDLIVKIQSKQNLGPIKVTEFGCGSGLFAKIIQRSGIDCVYVGFDISDHGIKIARSRKLGPNFSFQTLDVTKMEPIDKSDVSVFLGLSDWLTSEENQEILTCTPSPFLIWSYTLDSQLEIESTFYSVFRKLRNRSGMKTLSWRRDEIEGLFKSCSLKRYYPDQKFSFGPGFISCLVRKEGEP